MRLEKEVVGRGSKSENFELSEETKNTPRKFLT